MVSARRCQDSSSGHAGRYLITLRAPRMHLMFTMSSHSEATQDLALPLPTGEAPSSIGVDQTANVAEDAGTVSIELNFKAFADDVPTTEHARRAPNHGDPSIQDFADQLLELAALRAELKRLTRDHEILRQQARVREARMVAFSRELSSARVQLRQARGQQSQATAPQAERQPETRMAPSQRRRTFPNAVNR